MIDDVIPKVLREVLDCRPIAEPRLPSPNPIYYSGYQYPMYSVNNYNYTYNFGPSQYPMPLDSPYKVEEQEALSSLCVAVHARLISQDPDLASRFDQIGKEIGRDMGEDMVVASKRRCWGTAASPMILYESPNGACCIS